MQWTEPARRLDARPAAERRFVIRHMEPQLAYLKSVIEGVPGIEPWKAWFERNDSELQRGLPRTTYLDLKLNRISAIPAILAAHGIEFVRSDRYAFLDHVEGRCRDCGAEVQREEYPNGGHNWCPNGCFDVEWER